MALDDIFQSYKGLGATVLKDGSNNIIMLPNPAEATIQPGVSLAEVLTTNALGETVRAKRYPQNRDPRINLTFGNKTPQTIGLNAGSRFATEASLDTTVQRSFLPLPQSGIIAASGAGQIGNGVAADAPSRASTLDATGLSSSLTQGTYAGFDSAATPDEFAVGADMEILVGDNLKGKSFIIESPISLTNITALSDTSWGQLSLNITVILDDFSVVLYKFPKVSPDPTADITLNEPSISVPFFIDLSASDCKPYEVEYLNQVQFCG